MARKYNITLTVFIIFAFTAIGQCKWEKNLLTAYRNQQGKQPILNMYSIREKMPQWMVQLVIGGFKGIVVDLLWLKTDYYWDNNQWWKLVPSYYIVASLQPHFLEVWEVGSWHMIYNLAALAERQFKDKEKIKEEKNRWIKNGLRFLKEGIKWNRESYRLYNTMAITYYENFKDYNKACKFWEKAIRYNHPSWVDRMLAYSYQKAGKFESAYALWQHLYNQSEIRQSESEYELVKTNYLKLKERLQK